MAKQFKDSHFDRSQDARHAQWADIVKKRDGFKCKICGHKGGTLHSHHKNSYAYYHTDRYDLKNGITLCEKCHNLFHSMYGKNINTKSQFEEFKKITLALSKMERVKRSMPLE